MRISKKEREKNARQFYENFVNGFSDKAAIVVRRYDSTTNPNVNRVQFLAVISGTSYGEPNVIAESSTLGIEGCFMELFGFLKGGKQTTYYEDGFNKWMKETYGFEITYKDGLVFMLEKSE